MSQIQANTGLITGIPIQETVDQLMEVAARPRDRLETRTEDLENQRTAIDQVASLLLGFRFAAGNLNSASNYTATKATSSNESLLSVAVPDGSQPRTGTYNFTPLQQAAAHQLVSSSFTDVGSQLGSGIVRMGVGGQVDRGLRLSELNAGQGVASGQIRITDRNGASADIDLRAAVTIDDVLTAINSNGQVDVTASVDGDAIRLTDSSGGSGNLRVREVGLGTTAAGLGLADIDTASDEATGSDLFTLHEGTGLATLNDGTGVRLRAEVADLEVSLADGTVLDIDLGDATTLGQVVEAINAADDSKLTAQIAADGRRLELTDLTSGGETFAATSVGTGTAAEDLGLTTTAVGDTITGERLAAGLRDTLLSSLRGGQGVGTLGTIDIVDRAGNPAVPVDLASAETLSDVVDLINASGAQVTAAVNTARNGIVVTDESGGSGNLAISNADATNTADALGLTVDDAVEAVDSGSLGRQVVSESTSLASLNGGDGISLGDFRITDSSGAQGAVSLNDIGSEAETIGDVIDAINSLSIDVEARINDTGDGIVVTDLAGGSGTLTISEVGSGTTAADLRLLGASTTTNDSDQQVLDGRTSLEIDLSTIDTDEGVALSSLNNGNGISLGTFEVTDSTGEKSFAVQLDKAGDEAFTIQDVIDKINEQATAAGVSVTASLNSSNTGILLTDTAGGSQKLTVTDLGSGTSAAELKIAGEATTIGESQVIDGLGLFSAQHADQNALDALASAINEFDDGFSASTFFDGAGYRLSVTSTTTGANQELMIDLSEAGFTMQEVSRPQDAVLQVGSGNASGLIVSSADNTFSNVASGLDVTIEAPSSESVSVTVDRDTSKLQDNAEEFVESFNSIRTTLEQLTSFDAESATTGLLFGRSEVLRVETDLARVLTGAFNGSATFKSLATLGISLDDNGRMSLDSEKLVEALETNPAEVERFFTRDDSGVVDKLQAAIDQLAGEETSLLARRSDALGDTIETNEAKLESMSEFLERERERTMLEFFRLEEAVGQMQSNIDLLDSIQYIPPPAVARTNR